MNTRMRFEAMERALPYAAELLNSPEMKEAKERLKENKAATSGEMMQDLMKVLLITKRDAVFGLLGAVSGKTAEEIAEQDWEETIKLMNDPILTDICNFFIYSVRTVRIV